jgi:hypothetical protein
MTAHIRWTTRERDLFILKAAEHYNTDTAMSRSIRTGLNALDADRRRSVSSLASDADTIKQIKKKAQELITKPQAIVAPITPEIKAPEPIPAQLETTLDGLVVQVARQIALTFKQEIVRAVKELEHEFKVPKHNPEYESDRPTKRRIIIIGLLNDQTYLIGREFGMLYDIRCIDVDRAMALTPPEADAYLLMKNFINHPLYHKYQQFPNHVLIDGGMTTLRTWLNSKGKEL